MAVQTEHYSRALEAIPLRTAGGPAGGGVLLRFLPHLQPFGARFQDGGLPRILTVTGLFPPAFAFSSPV